MFKSIRFLFTAVIALSFIACQKEMSLENSSGTPGGGGGGGTVPGALKMKINGTQWVADNVAEATLLGGYINIYGLSKTHKDISINIADTVPGTYTLDQNSNAYAELSDSTENPEVYTSYDGQDTSFAGGTVVITSIDKVNKTISGTFKFKMYRDSDSKRLTITEGVIDKLPYISSLPPASSTDTLKVKVDGVLWTVPSIGAVSTSGLISINGAESDFSKFIGLSVPSGTTPGTYDFTTSGPYIGVYNPNSSTVLIAQSGKITILENNTSTRRIRGNFNFPATALAGGLSAQLTEGYFSVHYQ